jgi:cell division protein FtsL
MKNPFTEHPTSLNETYVEHFVEANKFSIALLKATVACAIHSVFPFMFQTTASSIVADLQKKMTNRFV